MLHQYYATNSQKQSSQSQPSNMFDMQIVADAPYLAPKPGGTDIGHVTRLQGQEYIVKVGIDMALLSQAFEHAVKGEKDRITLKLGFIAGNYLRLMGMNEKGLFTQQLENYFTAFLDTPLGKKYLEIGKERPLIAEEVTQIHAFMINKAKEEENNTLIDVINLNCFTDVINGSYGQHLSNLMQSGQNIGVAEQKILRLPKNGQIMLASKMLNDVQPFSDFLLEPFKAVFSEEKSLDEYQAAIKECEKALSQKLASVSLRGLNSAILFRHMMGEVGDLGADNMLIRPATGDVINIDITGFRYERMNDNLELKSFGWNGTLNSSDSTEIKERLYHASVFSPRFIKEFIESTTGKEVPKEEKEKKEKKEKVELLVKRIHNMITEALKNHPAQENIMGDMAHVKSFFARLEKDGNAIANMNDATREVYENLSDQFKFSKECLEKLIGRNHTMLGQAVDAAAKSEMGLRV